MCYNFHINAAVASNQPAGTPEEDPREETPGIHVGVDARLAWDRLYVSGHQRCHGWRGSSDALETVADGADGLCAFIVESNQCLACVRPIARFQACGSAGAVANDADAFRAADGADSASALAGDGAEEPREILLDLSS